MQRRTQLPSSLGGIIGLGPFALSRSWSTRGRSKAFSTIAATRTVIWPRRFSVIHEEEAEQVARANAGTCPVFASITGVRRCSGRGSSLTLGEDVMLARLRFAPLY